MADSKSKKVQIHELEGRVADLQQQLNERDDAIRVRRIDGLVIAWREVVRWGSLVAIAFILYRTVAVAVGTTTFADVAVKFLVDVNVSKAAAWAVAILFGVYGARQRKLRRDAIERLGRRPAELEKLIDSGRSSSKLTTRGETDPEDQ